MSWREGHRVDSSLAVVKATGWLYLSDLLGMACVESHVHARVHAYARHHWRAHYCMPGHGCAHVHTHKHTRANTHTCLCRMQCALEHKACMRKLVVYNIPTRMLLCRHNMISPQQPPTVLPAPFPASTHRVACEPKGTQLWFEVPNHDTPIQRSRDKLLEIAVEGY